MTDWDRVSLVQYTNGRHNTVEFWQKLFENKPDALHSILYDIVATKRGCLGKGRRKRLNGSLDEVWTAVFGEEE